MNPVLLAEDLLLTHANRPIFEIENFALNQGQVMALVGPNGAGKTSLLLTLALLQKPTSGVVRINGQAASNGNMLGLRRKMAVVFQEPLLLNMTTIGNLVTALRIRGVRGKKATTKAGEWLERFGVAHLAHQQARSLSGGEAQRASLARAFALEPELLFLDEPFASLDYPTRNALLSELGKILNDMKTTTLFVTHDYSEIPYLAQRATVMYQGRIIKCGAVRDVFGDAILERRAWAPWEAPQCC